MCAAPIIAPQPVPNGIPFAHLERAEPVTKEASKSDDQPNKPRRGEGRVIMADGGFTQTGTSSKNSSSNSQIIVFVILAVLFLLVGIWLIAEL